MPVRRATSANEWQAWAASIGDVISLRPEMPVPLSTFGGRRLGGTAWWQGSSRKTGGPVEQRKKADPGGAPGRRAERVARPGCRRIASTASKWTRRARVREMAAFWLRLCPRPRLVARSSIATTVDGLEPAIRAVRVHSQQAVGPKRPT